MNALTISRARSVCGPGLAPELYFADLELEHCRWIVGRLHSGSPLRLACPSEERLGDRDDWHAGCRERSYLLEKVATMLVHADLLVHAAAGRFQPSQSTIAPPITRSRSRPFSHGSSSVNIVTHCRYEHGMRVMSVPQNERSGPNASKTGRRHPWMLLYG